uniref:Uncharacterized protein n=1 Tax=Moniliophthora roreri TaxID=221103 RepID=A0A0W0FLL5_MONRR
MNGVLRQMVSVIKHCNTSPLLEAGPQQSIIPLLHGPHGLE